MALIPVCIFTYAGDALPLRECVKSVLAAQCLPVICDESTNPLPEWVVGWAESMGAEYLVTFFPRRGNLNGTDCAAGIARTMANAAKRHGACYAIKLDADTVLIDPTRYAGNAGVCSSTQARRDAFGACYSLKAETAASVAVELEFTPLDETAPEDLTIWQTVRAITEDFQIYDFNPAGGMFSAVPFGADPAECLRFAAVTYGNAPAEGWADRPLQIAQEMAKLNQFLALANFPCHG
jgi:hypothetical protein